MNNSNNDNEHDSSYTSLDEHLSATLPPRRGRPDNDHPSSSSQFSHYASANSTTTYTTLGMMTAATNNTTTAPNSNAATAAYATDDGSSSGMFYDAVEELSTAPTSGRSVGGKSWTGSSYAGGGGGSVGGGSSLIGKDVVASKNGGAVAASAVGVSGSSTTSDGDGVVLRTTRFSEDEEHEEGPSRHQLGGGGSSTRSATGSATSEDGVDGNGGSTSRPSLRQRQFQQQQQLEEIGDGQTPGQSSSDYGTPHHHSQEEDDNDDTSVAGTHHGDDGGDAIGSSDYGTLPRHCDVSDNDNDEEARKSASLPPSAKSPSSPDVPSPNRTQQSSPAQQSPAASVSSSSSSSCVLPTTPGSSFEERVQFLRAKQRRARGVLRESVSKSPSKKRRSGFDGGSYSSTDEDAAATEAAAERRLDLVLTAAAKPRRSSSVSMSGREHGVVRRTMSSPIVSGEHNVVRRSMSSSSSVTSGGASTPVPKSSSSSRSGAHGAAVAGGAVVLLEDRGVGGGNLPDAVGTSSSSGGSSSGGAAVPVCVPSIAGVSSTSNEGGTRASDELGSGRESLAVPPLYEEHDEGAAEEEDDNNNNDDSVALSAAAALAGDVALTLSSPERNSTQRRTLVSPSTPKQREVPLSNGNSTNLPTEQIISSSSSNDAANAANCCYCSSMASPLLEQLQNLPCDFLTSVSDVRAGADPDVPPSMSPLPTHRSSLGSLSGKAPPPPPPGTFIDSPPQTPPGSIIRSNLSMSSAESIQPPPSPSSSVGGGGGMIPTQYQIVNTDTGEIHDLRSDWTKIERDATGGGSYDTYKFLPSRMELVKALSCKEMGNGSEELDGVSALPTDEIEGVAEQEDGKKKGKFRTLSRVKKSVKSSVTGAKTSVTGRIKKRRENKKDRKNIQSADTRGGDAAAAAAMAMSVGVESSSPTSSPSKKSSSAAVASSTVTISTTAATKPARKLSRLSTTGSQNSTATTNTGGGGSTRRHPSRLGLLPRNTVPVRSVHKQKNSSSPRTGNDGDTPSSSSGTRRGKSAAASKQRQRRGESDPMLLISSYERVHKGPIWCMSFSRDGKFLATGGEDGRVLIWSVGRQEEEEEKKGEKGGENGGSGCERLDEERDEEGDASVEDQENSSPRREQVTEAEKVSPMSSRDEEEEEEGAAPPPTTVGGGAELGCEVKLLSSKPIRIYTDHTADVIDFSWSHTNFLLSASLDKTVRLYHVSRPHCLHAFKHADLVTSVDFHPTEDRYFLSGGFDRKLRVWSIPEGRVREWAQAPEMITAARYTPSGTFVVAGLLHGQVYFYNVSDGRLSYYTQISCKNRHGSMSVGKKVTGFGFLTALKPERRSVVDRVGGALSGSVNSSPSGNSDATSTLSAQPSSVLPSVSSPTDIGHSHSAGSGGSQSPGGSSPRFGRISVRSSPKSTPKSRKNAPRFTEQMVVTTNDSRLRLFSLDDYCMVRKYKAGSLTNTSMQIKARISESGQSIVCGSEVGNVYLWKVSPQSKSHQPLHLNMGINSYDRTKSYESFEASRASLPIVTDTLFVPGGGVKDALLQSGLVPTLPTLDHVVNCDMTSSAVVTSDYEGTVRVFLRRGCLDEVFRAAGPEGSLHKS